MNNFTDQYQKAAEYKGKNIAVSASAGCGKTTAMIKRIENIIISEHIKVNELLVVTFTKAAAAEMKNRLKSSLAAHPMGSFAHSQVYDVEISDISTLHSFCSKICGEFFNIAEIPADFTIIEENDSAIYKSKILRDVIEGYYADNDEVFWELSNIFSVGRSDEGLVSAINRLYNIIVCKPDGKEYLKSICDKCYKGSGSNPAIMLLQQDLSDMAKDYTQIISAHQDNCEKYNMSANSVLLENILSALSQINISGNVRHSYDRLRYLLDCLSVSVKTESQAKDSEIIKCVHEKTKEIKSRLKKTAESFLSKFAPALDFDAATKLNKAAVYANKLCEAAIKLFDSFMEFKKENAFLDYNDLEYYTLKILSSAESRKTISDRYKYIFVDEFQDINGTQDKIISLLQKENNLFIVGDFKQSIYRFRGADNIIFKEKTDNSSFEQIFLDNNFRSDTNILNFINQVFIPVMREDFSLYDYKKTGQLKGSCSYALSDGRPAVVVSVFKPADKEKKDFSGVYSVKEHCQSLNGDTEAKQAEIEGKYIAQQIKKLVNNVKVSLDSKEFEKRRAQGKDDEIGYDDIAILVRKNKTFTEQLYKQLINENIPVSAEISYSISEYFEITQIINYLKCIDNFYQDIPLLSSLTGYFGKFTYDEIAAVRAKYKKESFYQSLISYAENQSDEISRKIKVFINKTQSYGILSKSMPCPRLIMQIIKDAEYEEHLLSLDCGEDCIDRVNKFLQIIYQKTYSQNLSELLKYIEFADSDIKLQANSGSGKVRLCTIHNSKGLEYPIVFLAGCGEEFTFTDISQRLIADETYGLAMDYYDTDRRIKLPSFVKNALSDRQKYQLVKEEINTLYVALTRAKYRLYISGSYDISKFMPLSGIYSIKNSKRYFDFILNIVLQHRINAHKIYDNFYCVKDYDITYEFNYLDNVNDGKAAVIQKKQSPAVLPLNDYDFMGSTKQPVKTAVTNINKYIETQYEDDYENTFSLTSEDSADIGTAYHKLLAAIDFKLPKQQIADFIKSCIKNNIITALQAQSIDVDIIWKILNLPCIKQIAEMPHFREKPFITYISSKEAGGDGADNVLMQGVIDVIAVDKDKGYIIDYKYSVRDSEYLKNRYRRQLELYSLAAEQILGIKVISKIIINIKSAQIINV